MLFKACPNGAAMQDEYGKLLLHYVCNSLRIYSSLKLIDSQMQPTQRALKSYQLFINGTKHGADFSYWWRAIFVMFPRHLVKLLFLGFLESHLKQKREDTKSRQQARLNIKSLTKMLLLHYFTEEAN
jgi:hypothetical protein